MDKVTDSERSQTPSDNLERRLKEAERTLEKLQSDEYPHLKRLLVNSLFTVRAITDKTAFVEVDASSDRKRLIESSESTGYLLVNMLGVPQATLFYNRSADFSEQELITSYCKEILTLLYATIGLDMQRVSELQPETLKQILRAGIPDPSADDAVEDGQDD